MVARHFGYELAILVILCIVGIFLFPAAGGPYAAVHGPTTALLAARAASRMRWAMAVAGLGLASLISALAFLRPIPAIEFETALSGRAQQRDLLRC